MVAMPVQKLPLWLASINPAKIPDLAQVVDFIDRQNERTTKSKAYEGAKTARSRECVSAICRRSKGAKARGHKLGGRPEGQVLTDDMRAAGRAAMARQSSERASELAPINAELKSAVPVEVGGNGARRVTT